MVNDSFGKYEYTRGNFSLLVFRDEFGIMFTKARIISKLEKLREDNDHLSNKILDLRQEVKVLRAHNFLPTKSNFEIRNSIRTIERILESWMSQSSGEIGGVIRRLEETETEVDLLCATLKDLNLGTNP